MKRKRGHKKKKSKKLHLDASKAADSEEVVVESPGNNDNGGDSSSEEEIDDNNRSNGDGNDEEPVVEAPAVVIKLDTPPPPPPPRERERVVSIRPDGVIQRPPPTAVYGRVRVKLKTKPPTPQPTPGPQPEPKSQPQVQLEPKPQPQPQVQPEHKPQPQVQSEHKAQPQVQPELKPQPQVQPEIKPQPQVQPEIKPQPQVQPEPKPLPQVQPELKPQPQVQSEAKPKPQVQSEAKPQPQVQSELKPQPQVQSEPKPQPQVQSEPKPQPQVQSEPKPQPQVQHEPIPQPESQSQSQYHPEPGLLEGQVGNSERENNKSEGGRHEVNVEKKDEGEGYRCSSGGGSDIGSGSGEKGVEESGNSGSAESKKSGGTGIKIVSKKSLSLSPPGGTAKESGRSRMSPEADEEEEEEVEKGRPKVLNKKELEASLEVIKKVMKMDAAEPFNAPVNPIELGIPDYFDVIDTPMDFGTIRRNLESGGKYLDSEDVYKDVQYIWDNCFKYNNKGDYIVDLMKRVKKNFLKYWAAAGLYPEQTKKTMNDSESPAVDEPTTSGLGKKLKKGKGFKRHKDDCLCAVCIMKRRRKEREEREAREAGVIAVSPQIRVPQTSMAEEYKEEEKSHAESPGEGTSFYMETSPNGDADTEMEDEETRLEGIASQYDDQQKAGDGGVEFYDRSGDVSEKSLQSDKGDIELYSHVGANLQDDSGRMMIDAQEQPAVHPEEPFPGYLQQRHEMQELEKKHHRLRLLETFRDLENPMLSGLCGTLFPNNAQSVWNGANSLVRCQRSCHRKSGIHEAVASFVDPSYKSASSLK